MCGAPALHRENVRVNKRKLECLGLMKTLLCCLGLLGAMGSPDLYAKEVAWTRGVHQTAVEAYLQTHVAKVSRSGGQVVLCGDGDVFTVKHAGQNITGFSDRIVLRQEGDSFVANFGAGEKVNTVLTLVRADAGRVELRYRVMDSRGGALRIDEGAVYLAVARARAGA